VTTRHEQAAVVDESVAATEEVRRAIERLADDGVGGRIPNVSAGKAVDVVVAIGGLLARKDEHLAVRQQARVDGDDGAAADAVKVRNGPPGSND
jgi:hypothetical protein